MAPARVLRVLHLVGSPTNAFFDDLSRLYARGCLDAVADPTRYEPVIAHVSPDGSWRFPDSLDDLADAPSFTEADAAERVRALTPDVAVPQLFCHAGMTSCRQLLVDLGVPFVGNIPAVMALGADKPRCRDVVAAAGVPVPPGQVLAPGEPMAPAELPVVVKPADSDNSAGVTLVREAGELPAALAAAWAESPRALVERFVPLGREVRCGVLEQGDDLLVLPLEEYAVDANWKPIRPAADKLARDGGGQLGLVAKDVEHAWIVGADDPLNGSVGAAALAAHRALGCRHYSLFDFRVDPDGRPWFLEAGLYCSFSPSSVVAVMAAAAGIPVQQLFADALAQALRL